jgi:hypothetical protein
MMDPLPHVAFDVMVARTLRRTFLLAARNIVHVFTASTVASAAVIVIALVPVQTSMVGFRDAMAVSW